MSSLWTCGHKRGTKGHQGGPLRAVVGRRWTSKGCSECLRLASRTLLLPFWMAYGIPPLCVPAKRFPLGRPFNSVGFCAQLSLLPLTMQLLRGFCTAPAHVLFSEAQSPSLPVQAETAKKHQPQRRRC